VQIKQIDYGSPDYFETLELRTAILRTPLGKTLSTEDTDGEEKQLHFGCFSEQNLIACAVIKIFNKGSYAKLRQMAVADNAQGKGIGKKLILKIENILREQGFKKLELSARKTAQGFYEKLGYQASGGYYLEQGIEHIKMQKTS
jgi:predicted GNAT family N-acyltransferase